jgi:hypothetical protein
MKHHIDTRPTDTRRKRRTVAALSLGSVAAAFFCSGAMSAGEGDGATSAAPGAPTLADARLTMGKWIETQQIISKEQNDWQQGKEILKSRIELLMAEIASLEEKSRLAETSVRDANAKRSELLAQQNELTATRAQLVSVVKEMEAQLQRLFKILPDPIKVKLEPLQQRIPQDPDNTRASPSERFQNVIGMLNEINKANNEINVTYEVRTLSDGKPSEVRTMYIGLAQAYYVGARGEAGVGRPSADGWTWEPAKSAGDQVLRALEITQGKQLPPSSLFRRNSNEDAAQRLCPSDVRRCRRGADCARRRDDGSRLQERRAAARVERRGADQAPRGASRARSFRSHKSSRASRKSSLRCDKSTSA